jgi:agmatine deiminase
MPAEFATHDGCWIFWPERPDKWREGAKPAQRVFAQIAVTIARFERVTVATSREQFLHAREILPPSIRVIELSYNDSWTRDMGPTFVTNGRGEIRGIHWQFNAHGGLEGGLYFPWDLDALAAQKILEIERIDRYKADLVMEGGSFHVDGEGTLLTTEECLLNPNRNPRLHKESIEERLQEYLGVEKIIWLNRGLWLDEVSGHVDNLCCFARPGVIALNWTDDRNDPQYDICQAAFDVLSNERDAKGRRFEVHKICQPQPLYMTAEESNGVDRIEGTRSCQEGDRLTASYINFYIANSAVIVPLFDDAQDEPAIAALKTLFPEREVIGIRAREVVLGGGGIHCMTQQQPARA